MRPRQIDPGRPNKKQGLPPRPPVICSVFFDHFFETPLPHVTQYHPTDTSRYKKIESAPRNRPDQSAYVKQAPLESPRLSVKFDPSKKLVTHPTKRHFADWRTNGKAYETLAILPAAGETLHTVISGAHTLWALVPALAERTGSTFEELYISTLSFSAEVADQIIAGIDTGMIKRFGLYVSVWTADTESGRKLHDYLVPKLLERDQLVMVMNVHAKLILARMTNGSHYVCEASVNLRSCRAIEQVALTHDAELYRFHRSWMQECEAEATKLGRHGEKKHHSRSKA